MMKKRLLALLLSAALVLGTLPISVFAQDEGVVDYGTPGVDYVEGEVIACVKGGAAALQTSVLRRASAYSTADLMAVTPESEEISTFSLEGGSEKSLVLVTGSDTEGIIADLESNPAVEYAEPNYILKMTDIGSPSDPGYPYQWGLNNQLNSPTGADMKVKDAWAQAPASAAGGTPVVAVLDSGVDYRHKDLEAVMWDEGEKFPALTGMGGGKYGYNPGGRDTTDPMDTLVGHGTHCAGVIAAQWDNGLGGAGVAKDCEIMGVKMFGETGGGNLLSAIKGYAYIQAAKEAGVNVVAINNSWGPSSYNGTQMHSISTASDSIGRLGVVSCFAAGNEGTDNDLNVSGLVDSPYVLNVGAMDSEGYPTYFTCYGKRSVDVFSPGAQILSATSTDTTVPMDNHEMPVQYLPWIQAPGDSVFYENFEGGSPSVRLQLYNQAGRLVDTAAQAAASPGYLSDTGSQINLSAIPDGETFSIQLSFDKDKLSAITGTEDLYLAFQGSMGSACYGKGLILQAKGTDGSWQSMDSSQVYQGQSMPLRLRFTDHNWNVSTGKVKAPLDLLSSLEGNEIVLRLSGTMTGNIGDTVFRLDDFGIGTKPSDYYYADGTSMATPMITGLAALLSTTYTTAGGTMGENALEMIARIKGGVDRSTAKATGLTEKSVSGGYADAEKAFTDPVPVLNDLVVSGSTAVITGYFFGAGVGTVAIGGESAPVTAWGDREITVTLPDGISGMPEVTITRSDGEWGRNFFTLEPDYRGYSDLAVPDIRYGQVQGNDLTSADGIPVAMAGAGHTLLYLGMMAETNTHYMEAYDIQTGTWRSVPLPSQGIVGYGMRFLYQLAGGKSKIYMLYSETEGQTSTVKIGTFDPERDTWSSVKADLNGTEALAVYGNQLLVIGGDVQKDDAFEALTTVRIVDPTTGQVIGNLPELPEGRSGSVAYTSGNTLIVAGGYSSVINKLMGKASTAYGNTMVFDGSTWTKNDDNYFDASASNPNYDLQQTLDFAAGAVDHGLILTGPVKNLGKSTLSTFAAEGMMDTWHLDTQTSSWSGDSALLYSSQKTTKNVGASLNGQFYALGYRDGLSDNLVFRATPVAYTPPTGNPGEQKPSPTPDPTVEPQTTTSVTAANSNTGLSETGQVGVAIALLAALTAVIIAGVYMGKKKLGYKE